MLTATVGDPMRHCVAQKWPTPSTMRGGSGAPRWHKKRVVRGPKGCFLRVPLPHHRKRLGGRQRLLFLPPKRRGRRRGRCGGARCAERRRAARPPRRRAPQCPTARTTPPQTCCPLPRRKTRARARARPRAPQRTRACHVAHQQGCARQHQRRTLSGAQARQVNALAGAETQTPWQQSRRALCRARGQRARKRRTDVAGRREIGPARLVNN
jgi:hypothetical protein